MTSAAQHRTEAVTVTGVITVMGGRVETRKLQRNEMGRPSEGQHCRATFYFFCRQNRSAFEALICPLPVNCVTNRLTTGCLTLQMPSKSAFMVGVADLGQQRGNSVLDWSG